MEIYSQHGSKLARSALTRELLSKLKQWPIPTEESIMA